MELRIEKSDLLNGINIVSKAVASSGTQPILGCIRLAAFEENEIQMSGNNLEMGIETRRIDADVNAPGVVALNARLLADIVKKLPDDVVHIKADAKNVVIISCGKSVFKIVSDNPDEFPPMPEVGQENRLVIKENLLRDMIRQTIFSVDITGMKPAFSGELLKVEDGVFCVVSIDGFRISYREHKTEDAENPFSVIVPGKTLGEIMKLLSVKDEAEATICYADKNVLFELESCTVASRIINGEFMDYAGAFLAEHNTLVKANRAHLLDSIDRATIIAAEPSKKTPVILEIAENTLTITARTEKGSVKEEIAVDTEGGSLTIHFNPKYLMDALKAISDTDITMRFGSQLTPCVIAPVGEGNYKYLILPLRPR